MPHPLLTAPIGPSLLRLAGPTTAVMVVQIFVAIADVWIMGRLGVDALAGIALVFPMMALMANSANGGIGGGVAAAVARAMGAGRKDDARALVVHALVLAVAFGLAFAALAWTGGPAFYRLLGGEGVALARAVAFSDAWYSGAVVIWLGCLLAALLRGAGAPGTAARISAACAIAYVPLAYVLALGVGGWPGLGMIGPAIASIATTAVSALLMVRAITHHRLGIRPSLAGFRLQPRLFGEILGVGTVSLLGTLVSSVTAMTVTGFVGRFGAAALAGYGVGMRLEFMVGPLAFGIGTGLTTLVGVAAGANDWKRARQVAWTGALISFALTGGLAALTALLPENWSRLFTGDAAVVVVSTAFLTRVAPFYGLLGLGLALYFASQGAGRMKVPFAASVTRMLVATMGSWLAVERLGLGLDGVFFAVGVGIVAYGGLIGGALLLRPWRASPL